MVWHFGLKFEKFEIHNFLEILPLVTADVLKNALGSSLARISMLCGVLVFFVFIPWCEALFFGEAFRQSRGGATKICARVFQFDFSDVNSSWIEKGRRLLGVIFNGESFYHGVRSPRGSQIPGARWLSSNLSWYLIGFSAFSIVRSSRYVLIF